MIQQLALKETRFLLTWFQPWRGLRHSCSEPSSPTRPHTSLAPQKATSQNHAQKFPIPLSVLKPAEQRDLHPLWNVHCGFQTRHPLAAALSFRIWGTLFSASRSWFRETCATLHWMVVGSREAQSQEGDFSVRPSEKQKSVAQHSWL